MTWTTRILSLGVACAMGGCAGWFLCEAHGVARIPIDQVIVEEVREQVPWGADRPMEAIHPPDPAGLQAVMWPWFRRAPDQAVAAGGWAFRLTTSAPDASEVMLRREPFAIGGGGTSESYWLQLVGKPTSIAAQFGRSLWGE